jgi:hypothetical protein
MTTKLTTSNLSADTLAAISGPRISNVKIADSSYNTLDDTAANISGGFIIINGQNFISNCQVLIDNTPATTVTFVSNSVIRAQVPASAEGTTKSIYVVNPDGSSAIIINGLTYSAFPAWSTGSTLTSFEALVPVSIQLSAPSATVYTLAAANTLPSSLSLYANGLIAGTVAANTTTNYNFTVNAKDAENQDTNRNFTLPITQNVEPAWVTSANLVGVDAGINYSNTLVATDNSNVTYSVAAGSSLPSSLTLNANGLLSGNVSSANTYSFGIVATDTGNLSNTRTFTLTITAAGDTYFKYTTLLLNGETTVTPFISDASTNSFGSNINGDTKPVLFNPYQGDGYYSNLFDGTDDKLNSTLSSGLGSGDFTAECWVNFTSTKSGDVGIFQIGNSPTAPSNSGIGIGRTNGVPFLIYNNTYTPGSISVGFGVWRHVAVVRQSGTIKLYVNGVESASVENSTNYTETNLLVGGYYSSSYLMSGYISNLRVVTGTAVYTSTFTPPTTPLTAITNTSLLTCQSNRLIDKSTNNVTITKAGDAAVSPYIPFPASSSYSTYGSGYFDGTGDYLRIPDNAALQFGSGNWTVEFWVYLNTIGTYRGFFSKVNDDSYYNGVSVGTNASGDLWVTATNNGAAWQLAGPNLYAAALTTGRWQHIAIVRNSNTITGYVDGVAGGTPQTLSGTVNDTGASFFIGSSNGVSAGQKMDGYINNFRFVKGTAVYTTAFTPPTSTLTAIANTSLLTLQYNGTVDNKGIIDNGPVNNIITRSGNTSQGTFSPYSVTGWSNYFDGTGDYLSPSSNTPMDFGTGNFTIEGWFLTGDKSISGGANRMIIGNSGNSYTMQLYIDSSGFLTFGNTGSTFIRGSTDLANNIWNHFAIVRSGTGSGQIKMYVNGIEVASGTNSITYASGTIFIGAFGASDGFWNGYISNLRIVKGTAVYTTAFTPSTTPLTAIANTSLLTCQSNGFIDKSTNNVTLTPTADVSVQAFSPFAPSVVYNPSLHGGSAYFDGTGDFLTTPDSSTVANFGNLPFTVEFWMYSTDAASVIIRQNAAGTPNWAILITSGYIYWQNGYEASSLYYIVLGSLTTNPLRNAWTHIAITRNGSNELKFWINGVGQSSVVTDSTNYNSTNGVVIGSGSYGAYTGYLSDVRITKGVAVYTTTFTPPTQTLGNYSATYPASLLLNMNNGGIIDQHSGVVLETVGNAQLSTAVKKYGNASMYFDGTGDYLTIGSNNILAMGTGDFTVECWIYPQTTVQFTALILTGTFQLFVYNGALYWNDGTQTSGGTITLNAWQHIAVSRSGTTLRGFVNGIQVITTTSSVNLTQGTNYVGYNGTTAGQGYIDDLRLTKGIARYTGNFTPPTEALIAR